MCGLDPASNDPRLRQVLRNAAAAVPPAGRITPGEALDLFAAFYPDPRRTAELLGLLGLTSQADQWFERLSGGQQQRLSIALALIGRPKAFVPSEPIETAVLLRLPGIASATGHPAV